MKQRTNFSMEGGAGVGECFRCNQNKLPYRIHKRVIYCIECDVEEAEVTYRKRVDYRRIILRKHAFIRSQFAGKDKNGHFVSRVEWEPKK